MRMIFRESPARRAIIIKGCRCLYYAKNAPIDDLSELLLVKGVTPEMYWGSNRRQITRPQSFNINSAWHRARSAPELPLRAGWRFSRHFLPGKSTSTRRCERPANDSRRGCRHADAIIKQRDGPDGAEGTEDDIPFQNVRSTRRHHRPCNSHTHSATSATCAVSPLKSTSPRKSATTNRGIRRHSSPRTSGTVIQVLSFYCEVIFAAAGL